MYLEKFVALHCSFHPQGTLITEHIMTSLTYFEVLLYYCLLVFFVFFPLSRYTSLSYLKEYDDVDVVNPGRGMYVMQEANSSDFRPLTASFFGPLSFIYLFLIGYCCFRKFYFVCFYVFSLLSSIFSFSFFFGGRGCCFSWE